MLKTLLLKSAIAAAFCGALLASGASAQTVMVNYDFNDTVTSPGCTAAPAAAAPMVESTFMVSTGSCSAPTGVATTTDPAAFATNPENPSVSVQNSDITPAYFQFQLSGSALAYYSSYRIYLQTQRTGNASMRGTLQYSTDGTVFTDFQSFDAGRYFTPYIFDLSAGVPAAALDHQQTVYFRILIETTGRTSGNFRLDNFQVMGQLAPSAAGVSLSGRVVDSRGSGLRSVTVILMGGDLPEPLYASSSSMGYFEFSDIPAGHTYILAVSSGRYIFESPTMVVNLNDSFSKAFFISEQWGNEPVRQLIRSTESKTKEEGSAAAVGNDKDEPLSTEIIVEDRSLRQLESN